MIKLKCIERVNCYDCKHSKECKEFQKYLEGEKRYGKPSETPLQLSRMSGVGVLRLLYEAHEALKRIQKRNSTQERL